MAGKRRKLIRPKPLKLGRVRSANPTDRDGGDKVRTGLRRSDPVRVWKTFA